MPHREYAMDGLSLLITNNRTNTRFDRLVRAELRRHGLEMTSFRDDFCYITDGEQELSFSVSEERYAYARTHSDEEPRRFAARAAADFEVLDRMVSFTQGQNFLRITAMHSGEIKHGYICSDFTGGLKKVLCSTSDDIHTRIVTDDYLQKWDVPAEMLLAVADRNMSRLMTPDRLETSVMDAHGLKCVEMRHDELSCALMMCSGFYDYISPLTGPRFLLIAPSKDTVMAVTEPASDISGKLFDLVTEHNRWSTDPLTTNVYLYTQKGIEIASTFPDF